ncbi:hypothetical protein [Paenibacillus sp. BC26]|uniref:hypothetical protein n=1 Tax=Paenibacillus sp. BC26 TaxID=1881032 RepID=UPI0008EA7A9B|nr:hypothetical protein [Paenibacillus sp. BC26]SFT27236.1 hypothetical protein SAMN05428962_6097 [Paenibacillus sp. BC26]
MVEKQAVQVFALLSAIVMVLSFLGMFAYFFLNSDNSRPMDIVMLALNSCWIISLISIYTVQAGRLGSFGILGFIVTAIGLGWFMSFGFAHQFAGPVLEGFQAKIMDYENIPQPLLDGAYTAMTIVSLGFVLYGLAMIVSKVARWQGIIFFISGITLAIGYDFHILPLALLFSFLIPIAVFFINLRTLKEPS